eukprot:Hpha_TRINITY_DN16594_c2_g3::TRINITY_DN16594_c2_g3_i1::g.136640::m.136640
MTHKDTNTRMFTIEYTAAPLAASGAPTRTSVTTGLLDNSGLGLCIIGDTTYMTSRPDRVGGNAVISVKGTSMGVIKGTDSYTYEWTGGQLGYPVCDEDAGLVFFTYTSAWDKNPYPRETVLLQTPTGGGGVEEVLTAPAFLSSPPYKTEPGGLLPQFALVRGFPGIVYTGDVASNGRTATNAPDGVFLAENDGANPLAKSSKVWEGGSQVGPIVWMPNGVPPPSAKPTAKPQAADTEAPTVGQSTEAPSKPAPGATDSPTTTAPPPPPNTFILFLFSFVLFPSPCTLPSPSFCEDLNAPRFSEERAGVRGGAEKAQPGRAAHVASTPFHLPRHAPGKCVPPSPLLFCFPFRPFPVPVHAPPCCLLTKRKEMSDRRTKFFFTFFHPFSFTPFLLRPPPLLFFSSRWCCPGVVSHSVISCSMCRRRATPFSYLPFRSA